MKLAESWKVHQLYANLNSIDSKFCWMTLLKIVIMCRHQCGWPLQIEWMAAADRAEAFTLKTISMQRASFRKNSI